MKTFKELKKHFTDGAYQLGACEEEYNRLVSSKDKTQLLTVIKDNIVWAMKEGMSIDDLLPFGKDTLEKNHIYIDGVHNISVGEKTSIVLLGSSQATVETWDSSQATVKTLDSSQATVETWDSSQATVKTLDSSQATVETWGSSQATVETWGSSQATVETWGSSQATVKTLDSSQATVKTWGSSHIEKEVNDYSVLIDLISKEIFVVKGKNKIIEL